MLPYCVEYNLQMIRNKVCDPETSRTLSRGRGMDRSITATISAGDRPACRGAQLSAARGDDGRPGPTSTRVASCRLSPHRSTGEIAQHQSRALIEHIELNIGSTSTKHAAVYDERANYQGTEEISNMSLKPGFHYPS